MILTAEGRALTSGEIADLIVAYEGRDKNERSKIVSSLSAILSDNSKGADSMFFKSKNEKGEFIYNHNKFYDGK